MKAVRTHWKNWEVLQRIKSEITHNLNQEEDNNHCFFILPAGLFKMFI